MSVSTFPFSHSFLILLPSYFFIFPLPDPAAVGKGGNFWLPEEKKFSRQLPNSAQRINTPLTPKVPQKNLLMRCGVCAGFNHEEKCVLGNHRRTLLLCHFVPLNENYFEKGIFFNPYFTLNFHIVLQPHCNHVLKSQTLSCNIPQSQTVLLYRSLTIKLSSGMVCLCGDCFYSTFPLCLASDLHHLLGQKLQKRLPFVIHCHCQMTWTMKSSNSGG